MFRLQKFATSLLIVTLAAFSVPAVSQAPALGAKVIVPPKPSARVQALLDAGHKAQDASPAKIDEAEILYKEALTTSRESQDAKGESKALLNLGNVCKLRNQLKESLDYYQQTISVCMAHNDKFGQSEAYRNIALLLSSSQLDTAIENCRRAVSLNHETGDTNQESSSLTLLGHLLNRSGKVADAKEQYNHAISLAHSIKNERAEADAWWYLGTMFYAKTGFSKADRPSVLEAKDYFQKALDLYIKLNDGPNSGWTFDLIGDIFVTTGQYEEAQKQYKQSVLYYGKSADPKTVASVLRNLANTLSLMGRDIEALQYDEQSLHLYQKSGDKSGEAVSLMHIASLYDRVGQPATSLGLYSKALPLLEQSHDVYNEVAAIQAIAYYYDILNDHGKALPYLKKLVPLLQLPASGYDKMRNLDLLAATYYQTKDYPKAKETWEQLLPLQVQSGLSTASTLGSIGLIEWNMGNKDKALELYQREYDLISHSENSLNKAVILNSIAEIEEEKGNLVNAEKHLKEAIELSEKARSSLGGLSQAKTTFLNARYAMYKEYLALLMRLNKPEEAFNNAQKMKARALLDILSAGKIEMKGSMSVEEREQEKTLRQRSDALNYRLVKEGVQNEIGSKKRAEAIKAELAEAERELQVFEDSMYVLHPDIARKQAATTSTLKDTEKFMPVDTALLEYVNLSVGKTDETLLFVVTQRAGKSELSTYILPVKQAKLKLQIEELRKACEDPRKPYRDAALALYQTLIAPAKDKLAGKKRLLICPDGVLWDVPFAALLADNAPATNRKTEKFLIQQYEIAYAYSATGAQAELTALTNGRRRQPTKTMLAFANPDFGGELRFGDNLPDERLLSSASRPIPSASRKGDNPDRPIPSASRPIPSASRKSNEASRPIPSASRPIPSASRPIPSASRDPLQLLRGGYLSPLPGTIQEAQAIRSDFKNAVIYTKLAAQEETAKREAGDYRYLHFATHGFFNDAAPLLSAIILAKPDSKSGSDGFLTAREIFDLDLSADMVVMSACNTARGEKRNGEGLIGLTWALFAAGAPTQVVSQWSVNDASTALLMQNFYANLTREHMAKGASLRKATLSLLNGDPETGGKQGKYRHPYYWAPFILLGNWGK